MSQYNILSDSESVELQLFGLLNGQIKVTVDVQSHVSKLINSKSNSVGKDFNTLRTFFSISPTVVNLFNEKGPGELAKVVEVDLQKKIVELCKSVEGRKEKISHALIMFSFDPAYSPGNLYRVELTLLYR